MNGNFFQNPTFPTVNNDYENGYQAGGNEFLNDQQSYIENILRHNKGKKVKIYVSYPDSENCRDKVFDGILEQAGRDNIRINIHRSIKNLFIAITSWINRWDWVSYS